MGSLQSDGVGAGLAFGAPTSTTVSSKGGRLRRFCGRKCCGRRISALALQADVRAVTQSTMEQINVVAALGRHDLPCMMTRDARDVGLLVVDIGLLPAG